jgi:prephenate dehydrogenase
LLKGSTSIREGIIGSFEWRAEDCALDRLRTVAIIGVGLIGGSIGLALRTRRLAWQVVGVGRNPAALEQAVSLGAIDRGTTELEEGASRADVVVVCTPVNRIAEDVKRAGAAAAGRDVLVTDAGSCKRQIVEAVERQAESAAMFVGAHPLAGSERSGVLNAQADLFDGRVCVLTPTPLTCPELTRRARRFWEGLGCVVLEMGPAEHDEILAHTSHLPHALAAALAASVPPEWQMLAAGAFRDGTRVAAADPDLWTAIFRDNRGPLLKALGRFQETIDAFKYALMTDDEAAIRLWWETAKKCRASLDSAWRAPDFAINNRRASY